MWKLLFVLEAAKRFWKLYELYPDIFGESEKGAAIGSGEDIYRFNVQISFFLGNLKIYFIFT